MNNKLLSCQTCDRKFITKKGLDHHSRKHKDDIQFDCGICKRKFFNNSNLKRHIASHDTKKFNCNICDEFFATNEGLVEHHKIHLLKRSFTCYCCGKVFRFKNHLQRHLEKKVPCKWNFDTTAGLSQQYLENFESEILLDMWT